MQERYQAYEKLGRDRGTLRLEEDYPALPDDDEDDFGDGSGSESSGEVEPEEEDEEEAAVERHEQVGWAQDFLGTLGLHFLKRICVLSLDKFILLQIIIVILRNCNSCSFCNNSHR